MVFKLQHAYKVTTNLYQIQFGTAGNEGNYTTVLLNSPQWTGLINNCITQTQVLFAYVLNRELNDGYVNTGRHKRRPWELPSRRRSEFLSRQHQSKY